MARTTLAAINAELARRGHKETLVRGDRTYFYFTGGEAHRWYGSSVITAPLSGWTAEQWADERDVLANDYRNP